MMDYHDKVHKHIERAESGTRVLMLFSAHGAESSFVGLFWATALYVTGGALFSCAVTIRVIRRHLRKGRVAAYNDMIQRLDGQRLGGVSMLFDHPLEARMYKHALDLIREEQWVTDVDDTVAQLENMGDE